MHSQNVRVSCWRYLVLAGPQLTGFDFSENVAVAAGGLLITHQHSSVIMFDVLSLARPHPFAFFMLKVVLAIAVSVSDSQKGWFKYVA